MFLAAILGVFAVVSRPASAGDFFDSRPTLRLLEQRLPAGTTLAIPAPEAGAPHLASDLVIDATLCALLTDFLSPPATFAGQASQLVDDLCRTRPRQTALWVGTACSVYLTRGMESAEDDILRAITSGAQADPGSVAQVVRAALVGIAVAAEGRPGGRSPLAQSATISLIGRAVAAGVAAVRARPEAPTLTFRILAETLRLAREEQSSAILVEALAAIAKGAQGLDGLTPGEIARFAFAEGATTKETAGLICAGVLRGAGVTAASAVREQAAMTLSVPFASFVSLTSNAFVGVMEVPDAPGSAIARSITVTNADYIPALMIGATVCKPAAAVEILLAGLNRDYVLRGRSHTGDILRASLLAAPALSAELAAASVGRGDLVEGDPPALIAEAIARAAPATGVAAALTAQILAQPAEPGVVKATVAGALAGAAVANRFHIQAEITRAITQTSRLSQVVLDQAIASAPRQLQHVAILGVLATDPAEAPALLTRALSHPGLASTQSAPLAAAGGLLIEIQRAPASFFPTTLRRLTDPKNAAPETVSAILLAVALANPRGTPAVTAAAAVLTPEPSPAGMRIVVAQGNRGIAAGLEPAMDAALAVAEDEAATFRIVRDQVAHRPLAAAEIAAGAVAARPALAPMIGAAAARSVPGAAGAITRNLFAFSGRRHPQAPEGDSAAGLSSRLTGGIIRGILAARLDGASTSAAVSDAAASAVRSIFALARDPATHGEYARMATLAAVIEAATRAAPGEALGIARSAAAATRALAGSATPPAAIRDAVLAARSGADPAQVAAAVAAGVEDSDRHVPAASARILSDYSYDSLTGPALTRYLDL